MTQQLDRSISKGRSTSTSEKGAFSFEIAPEMILILLEIQKSPRGECPQTPSTIHALVHIKNTRTKGSQYKHIRKGVLDP